MKRIDEIKRVVVLGAGTMGAGIAQLSAQSGFETLIFDSNVEALQNGLETIKKNLLTAVEKRKISEEEKGRTLQRITATHNFSDLIAEVFIEAVIEKIEIKTELFLNLAKQNQDDAIFCTNTSSIPVTKIAESIPNPERMVGMHFFNPPHLMKLVEVISGEKTSIDNAETVFILAKKFDKEPVMARDAPGFIVNRIGKMFHTEPLKILEEKIASIESIDQLLEASGFKMGPFRLIDLIGVDANLNVTKSLYELFNHNTKFKPSALQQSLVDSGYLGRKSGKGFYEY